MGSSPSVVEVPPGHHIESIRTTSTTPSRRNRGFEEVEFQNTAQSTGSRNKPRQSQKSNSHSTSASSSQPNLTTSRQGAQTSSSQSRSPQKHHTAASSSHSTPAHRGRADSQDFHAVLSDMQREQTMINNDTEFEQPQYKDDEDLVLETFFHRNGTNYTCVYQGGQRYYLDSWKTQEWQPFPKKWYKEGILATDRVVKNEQNSDGQSASQAAQATSSNNPTRPRDDREGFLDHPQKGRLATYVFEEKRNVHYYFDKESGGWVRIPIAWELHTELVVKLVGPIEEALPLWKDKQDMLAALRASNYDPHDTIATYLANGDTGTMSVPRNAEDAKVLREKEAKIKELAIAVHDLKFKLDKTYQQLEVTTEAKETSEAQVQALEEKVSSIEVESKTTIAQMEAIQRERPKTAQRKQSIKPKTPEPEPEPQQNVDPDTVLAVYKSAKLLHKEYLKLKMESQGKFDELQQLARHLAGSMAKVGQFDSNVAGELEDMRELYRKEALQRKLLYNKLQELRGNIRVFCRCRRDDRSQCAIQFPSDQEVLAPNSKKPFKFDKVFTPESTQAEVFADTLPIITSCVDGYNVCIMAYGQTGSGKTHTMQGPASDPGVNVSAIKELLKICKERDNIAYSLKASMVEIYNENIQDLLTNDAKVLELRAQGNKVVIPGLVEMPVEKEKDIQHIMKMGDKNRSVASTKMNSQSSRSHLLFMIFVEGVDKSSGATSHGTLTLCDLAGSERVGKSEAQGQRLVEAAAINKSLSSLGQVFTALRTGQLHVPYRNSKLTHILQPSLGGNAKACLFVAISPDSNNVSETVSSLQFGSNARQVQLGQAKQNISKKGKGPDVFMDD